MSKDFPDAARIALSKQIETVKAWREKQNVLDIPWADVKKGWSEYYEQEVKKDYNVRMPYTLENGDAIIMLMSFPKAPKKSKNGAGNYTESFKSSLLSDDIKEVKKYIRVFDTKNNLFEDWYYREVDGKKVALTRIAWLRGKFGMKFRLLEEGYEQDQKLDVFLKRMNKNSLAEVGHANYKRSFTFGLWEIMEILNAGVD